MCASAPDPARYRDAAGDVHVDRLGVIGWRNWRAMLVLQLVLPRLLERRAEELRDPTHSAP